MNDAPERIWACVYGGSLAAELTNGPLDGDGVEYIRADLIPRWRPIAELPDEWKDGRYVIFRDKFNSDGGTLWTYHLMFAKNKWRWADFSPCDCFDDIGEFLDFGGHSMPAYDGA